MISMRWSARSYTVARSTRRSGQLKNCRTPSFIDPQLQRGDRTTPGRIRPPPLCSSRQTHRKFLYSAQEVRIRIDRLPKHLDLQVAPDDLLPQNLQLQSREPISQAAMDAEP